MREVDQFVDPENEHFARARKIDLAVAALNRERSPHLPTSRRQDTVNLAYLLANPDLPLEEIAQKGHRPIELLLEDFQLAQGAFQWGLNTLGRHNIHRLRR